MSYAVKPSICRAFVTDKHVLYLMHNLFEFEVALKCRRFLVAFPNVASNSTSRCCTSFTTFSCLLLRRRRSTLYAICRCRSFRRASFTTFPNAFLFWCTAIAAAAGSAPCIATSADGPLSELMVGLSLLAAFADYKLFDFEVKSFFLFLTAKFSEEMISTSTRSSTRLDTRRVGTEQG